MNRTKSILLAATALAMFTAPQVARAQSAAGAEVEFLPAPSPSGSQIACSNGGVQSGDTSPSVNGMSGDGQTIVGSSVNAICGVLWRNGTPGLIPSQIPGNPVFYISGISGDGRTVVGSDAGVPSAGCCTLVSGGSSGHTIYWDETNGSRRLPAIQTLTEAQFNSTKPVSVFSVLGNPATATANPGGTVSRVAIDEAFVNTNGSVLAVNSGWEGSFQDSLGTGSVRIVADGKVLRWSTTDGYLELPTFASNIPMAANGIDGSGNRIVGLAVFSGVDRFGADFASTRPDSEVRGFIWDSVTGLVRLPDLAASFANPAQVANTSATGISRDGTTVIGYSRSADGLIHPVLWRNGAITDLGFLPGRAPTTTSPFDPNFHFPTAANANGTVIVGSKISQLSPETSDRAWRWSSSSGMQDINVIAQDAGLSLNGFVLTTAVGISDNAQFITGSAFSAAQNQSLGYVLSIAAAPEPIPVLAFLSAPASNETPDASVVDISANGSVVAGGFGNAGIILWNGGSPTEVANARGVVTSAISGDGNTVTGELFDATRFSVVYRRATNDIRYLPDMAANEIAVYSPAVNQDGTFLAVTSAVLDLQSTCGRSYVCATTNRAYRWSETGGYQNLGTFGATWRHITSAISGDGGVIAGTAYDDVNAGNFASTAFRWTPGTGLQALPSLAAALGNPSFAQANEISRDGSTIVGRSRGADGLYQAVYWRGSTITALGYVPGTNPADAQTEALAANGDGSIIVGTNDLRRAWRWTSATGMQDLNLFAANAGINLGGFVLTDAVGLSDDGQIIAGNAESGSQYRGYVLSIAAAPPPPTTLTTSARLIVSLTLPGVTQTSIVNQTFSTQVDARLNGATVFTRTVGDQVTGTLGVTALADARTALQASSGLRRVVIAAPVLISNTTTVLSSSSNTVNVASGTQVTTAAVVTNGPATVATGDLGTCATAATDGVNPTGCSLPGTPVAVNANVINTNTFTNTINSVTPTTTTTVNQLISAKWQVSATAGNQFGTVHALVGPAAFDRGDRLIGQLLGMGGGNGQSESANRLSRTAMPVRDASGFGGDDGGLTMFGGYFGNWQHTDADPSVPVADVKGSTNGFVLGLEKGFGEARVGVAVDHGTSNYTVRDATYPETLGFKHTQVALFAGWQSGGFSLDGAAAYGFGTARTSLVTPTSPATASRDVKGWSLGAQAGYAVPLGRTASVELVGGVRHVSANLKAFTESGGPSPLQGRDQTVHRTRAYAGIEAQAGIALGSVSLTPRLHARYAHDSGEASGTADLVFASAPNGPVMQALGPGVGRDVAELGGSLDAAVGGNVHIWVGYDGTFRKGAQAHAAKAGVTVVW